jgi:type 1 glutamine amidotransferase/HEAT repeat protein
VTNKTRIINNISLVIFCILIFAGISPAVSPQEEQKIQAAAPAKAIAEPIQPRKLLVFNLCNGYKHKSIPYWDKALVIMGSKTAAYQVVVSSDMNMFKPENLSQFDVVCFNSATKLNFTAALRESLMNFVKSGKGIVGIHAAVDNFYDWPQGAEMMGNQFCGHPWNARGTWAVKIDEPDHPLTAAFQGKDFKINDEIFRTKPPYYSRFRQRVLMSLDMTDEATANAKKRTAADKDIGVSWVKSYGKGRLFYSSLGHNVDVTWNGAVLQHYLDGIQFALGDLAVETNPDAVGRLEQLLAEASKYDYGQSRQPLNELADFISNSYNCPQEMVYIEKQLLDFLRSDATPAAKDFICRKLSIIGSEQSVTSLAEMLTSPVSSDMARYALERIGGASADKALRKALNKTAGKIRIGIINSLGVRKDAGAVAVLGRMICDSDPGVAAASAAALGQIADSTASEVLAKALNKAKSNLREVICDAYLGCADQFAAKGQKAQALEIYNRLYAKTESVPVRAAALRGKIKVSGQDAAEVVADVLKNEGQAMQTAAIKLLRDIKGAEIIKVATAKLPELSVASQIQLLAALADRADRADKAALPAATNMAKNADRSVRIAALDALGRLGDTSTVSLLARMAAGTKGNERQRARESLYSLRGPKVDETIVQLIPESDRSVKIELIKSVDKRNITSAAELLLGTATDPDRKVRTESFKALRAVGDQQHLPLVLNLLIGTRTGSEQTEAQKAAIAAANKIAQRNQRAKAVLSLLASVGDNIDAKCALLGVLGGIGDSNGLKVLREGLVDGNAKVQTAAIKAVSDWPDGEPAGDLLVAAESAKKTTNQILALRGFVRLTSLPEGLSAEQMLPMYRKAMALAQDANQKKIVLSGLANIKSFEALSIAGSFLDEAGLQAEAQAAVVKIAASTVTSHPQQTKELLEKVITVTKNELLRKKAKKVLSKIK